MVNPNPPAYNKSLKTLNLNTRPEPIRGWRFSRKECVGLALGLLALLAFGANVEQRTALRRTPMTDLGVFACAAGAVRSGQNIYAVTDWHGWHYQYPPALAIVFTPLAHRAPTQPTILAAGVPRTELNTPWGYDIASHRRFFGLHAENARFFCIVAVWYVLSVALIFLSAHALACALERRKLKDPPPAAPRERRRWWWLRLLPLLVCAGSLATDLSRGQVDVIMLAAMSLGIYLAASGSDLKAGFWLSLPAALKLFPVLLIVYPIWRRRWRMLAGAVAGLIIALVILPSVALGPMRSIRLYRNWIHVLVEPALGQGTDTSRLRELTGMAGTDNQSVLAFIHNWRYHELSRAQRPQMAAPGERSTAYVIGGLVLLGVSLAMGRRRPDSPRNLLIIAGLLIGVALVVNPVSHNYYFLLLLPLIAGLLDNALKDSASRATALSILLVIAVFMLTDLAARLPGVGPWVRDFGLPLLSLVAIMVAGAMVLLERESLAADLVSNAPSPLVNHPSHAQ